MKKIISASIIIFSFEAFAVANCSAKFSSTAEFEKAKNAPLVYKVENLKFGTLNKIGKNRGVRISSFPDRFEVILADSKDNTLGKTILRSAPLNHAFSLTIDVPVNTESESLEVNCNLKK